MQITITIDSRLLEELILLTNAPSAQAAIEIAAGEKVYREKMIALSHAFPHMENLRGDQDDDSSEPPMISTMIFPWE